MSPLGVSPAGDQATVSIIVAVEPAVAFEVFTQETDLWWRRGLRPTITGTRVTVRHRGWSAIRPGHPVRHGVEGAAFSRMIGLWWGELMTGLREFIETDGAE